MGGKKADSLSGVALERINDIILEFFRGISHERYYPNTRVGVITGVADPDRLKGVRQLNPAFVCIKPINVGELLRQMQ